MTRLIDGIRLYKNNNIFLITSDEIYLHNQMATDFVARPYRTSGWGNADMEATKKRNAPRIMISVICLADIQACSASKSKWESCYLLNTIDIWVRGN